MSVVSFAIPRSLSRRSKVGLSTRSRSTGSCRSSRQCSLTAPAMCPSSYRSGFSSTSATTTLSSFRCSVSQSVVTSTGFAYPFSAIHPPKTLKTEVTPGRAYLKASELQLAGCPNDLPDHVEAENRGKADTREAEPLKVVHAGDQGRREEQPDDDDRRADSVGDRSEHVLEPLEIGGGDSDLQRPRLDPVGELTQPTWQACQRAELCVERAQKLIRCEVSRRLGEHQLAGLVLEQSDRIELGVKGPGDRIRLCKRLADQSERGRQPNPVAQADALQVGERLAGPDAGERAPVIARQLAPQLVDERGLVRIERGQRESENQGGHVVGAVTGDRDEKERHRRARLVIETAQQPEVQQREPTVVRE